MLYRKHIDQLTGRIKTLEAENLELKERIAQLEKNSSTSSKPSSSEIIHPGTNAEKKEETQARRTAGTPEAYT